MAGPDAPSVEVAIVGNCRFLPSRWPFEQSRRWTLPMIATGTSRLTLTVRWPKAASPRKPHPMKRQRPLLVGVLVGALALSGCHNVGNYDELLNEHLPPAADVPREKAMVNLPPEAAVTVLYRDDQLLALAKPSGMMVHRGWGRAPPGRS